MQKLIAPAILWLSSIAITIFCFSEIVFNPNTSMIGAGGDGIKNYYTYLYYIAKDGGNAHFSGMNYPFGEHIIFTDNMPLLAGAISWLKNWFPSIGHYSLAIMHLLLLGSITVGTWYVYKIIRKYNNNPTWAVISALFIAFFSPQLFKLYGHYGMGFCFYIPFVIYQLQCFKEKASFRYPIAIFICSIALAFIHLYNLALIAILVAFYCLAYFISEKGQSLKEKLRTIIILLSPVGLSFVLVKIFLKVTDTITDRPEYPHGILGYETQGKDLLVTDTPLGHIFRFLFGKPNGIAESEGKAYLGVVTLTICFILIFKFIRSFFKKYRATRIAIQPVKAYNIWLLVGLFHLLFAMGVPAVWMRSWLADYISVFRQFRTIGRFIWPFYYIIMIYASLYLYHYAQVLKTKHKAKLAYGLLSAAVILWAVQLSGYLKYNRYISGQALDNYTHVFETSADNWTTLLQEKGYRADDFQAAICLPFYHIGSEKIWLMDIDEGTSAYELFKVSLQTQLPIVNVMMSRTSWSQTFEMIRIIDGPYTPKKYFDRLNNKPLLLVVNEAIELKSKEKEWIKYATFIGRKRDKLSVYSIDINAMQQQESRAQQKALSAAGQALPRKEGLLYDSTSAFFYTNHFDHTGFEKSAFVGKSSFAPVYSRQKVPLDTILLPANRADSFYNLSLWAQCNMIDYRGPSFDLIQLDKNGQAVDTISGIGAKYSTHVTGDWFLVDKDFTIAPHAQKIVLLVHRNSSKKEYYAIDELLLRPQAATYFYWADEFKGKKKTLFLNNRPQF
ncbi:MAG: hypothetical protein JNM21_07725 [Taibaiella sp.]|nr:hypothetical protein [Taibaiella sp.]